MELFATTFVNIHDAAINIAFVKLGGMKFAARQVTQWMIR
jgi:hypothetical protein